MVIGNRYPIDDFADLLDERLADSDAALALRYPGDDGSRQPVHTVYVPADRYDRDLPQQWGRQALELLDRLVGSPQALADLVGMSPGLAAQVLPLVRDKLAREPIEDLRIDLEDGFGQRGDDQEDAALDAALVELLAARAEGNAPPFHGIRFKSLEAPTRRRGLRTLDRFVRCLARDGAWPKNAILTLPKVTAVEQVGAMVSACEHLEQVHGFASGDLRFEIQVETPQSIMLADGTAGVALLIGAAGGRCSALHYGTYDYSASSGIAAEYQSMEHPAADHAKAVMQVAAAGTGVRLSDGSTNIMPVGSDEAIRSAWSLHARLVDRSLQRGYYQGWDLHPGQLPTRYAATFAFYRKGFGQAAERLRAYVSHDTSGFLDEPATARALAWFISRGLHCGALSEDEVSDRTTLRRHTVEALALGTRVSDRGDH